MIRKILLGLTGLASIILSIVLFAQGTGGYESSYTYGGDAYTGIQNAAAQTANNVTYLGDIVKLGFGSVLLIAGLLIIIYAIFCREAENYYHSLNSIDTKIYTLNEEIRKLNDSLCTNSSDNQPTESAFSGQDE